MRKLFSLITETVDNISFISFSTFLAQSIDKAAPVFTSENGQDLAHDNKS